ncbi:MAG: exosortase family protein XrtF [Bacteroidia bacterium]
MLSKFIKDPGQRAIAGFLLKAVVVYILWFVSYDFFVAPDGRLDEWLNAKVAEHSAGILSLLGYQGSTAPGVAQTLIRIDNTVMVGVGNPCNGLELFALFTGFVLCFPGPWRNKWWFILLGVAGIHFINVLRATALALIQLKTPEYLDFNHHYTFTVVVYSFIFLLWVTWANKFSKKDKQDTAS